MSGLSREVVRSWPRADVRHLHARRKTQTLGRKARNRKLLNIGLILVALVIVLDALAGDRGLLGVLRVRGQYKALASTLARERADNARLAEQARRLREEPAAIEDVARRELGLIKPGERVFIIKDVEPPRAPTAPAPPESSSSPDSSPDRR
jgi:cell division protein FtsB